MIAKGNLHGSGAFLASYLAKDDKSNEQAELFELRGFMATNIFDALREAHADAEHTRAEKPLFHAQVRLPKDEQMTRDQWLEVADRIEKRLGFKDQPRAIVFHIKDGEEHMHIAWNRIDTEKERAIDPGLFKLKLKEVCRELEKEMGLQQIRNERDPEELTKTAARDEFEESRRLKTDLKEIRETIRECMDRSDGGKAFAAALGEYGYILAQGDRRDFVVIDEQGGQHALSKRITGLTAGQTRDRLADIDKANLPGVARAQEMQRERMAERERQRGEGDRDKDAVSRGLLTAFDKAKADATGKHKLANPDEKLTEIERVLGHAAARWDKAAGEITATRPVEKLEHKTAATFHAAAKATTRAADTLGTMADRFMTAAADFLVGGTPQKQWQPREVEKFTAEWRRDVAHKLELERNRNTALDRMREDRIAGRMIDSGELAHLNPADLQNIKDRGEAALQELIRRREIELERQRSRDRER